MGHPGAGEGFPEHRDCRTEAGGGWAHADLLCVLSALKWNRLSLMCHSFGEFTLASSPDLGSRGGAAREGEELGHRYLSPALLGTARRDEEVL